MKKSVKIKDKQFELYLSQNVIESRINEIARQINEDYKNKKPVFISILNGSFFFTADLIKQITLDCEVSFVKLASYKGLHSNGKVKIMVGLMKSLKNRDVIIIEDIIDSGRTMKEMLQLLEGQKPSSIRVITLLIKRSCMVEPVEPNYIGFEVDDRFLVGYGLDYDELGRNLPDLYINKEPNSE